MNAHIFALASAVLVASAGWVPLANAEAPSIVTQPRSRTNVVGSSLMLSVTANGTDPLTFQWSKDGVAIAGATGRTHVLTNVQLTNAGIYNVTVADLNGVAFSSDARLTVVPVEMPDIIGGPVINPADGHAYYLLAQSTWVEAEAQAQSFGGHLVTLRNAAEQEWVFTNFSTWGGLQRNLWIGLHDADPANNATNRIERQAEFVWASGEPVTYANWNASEPNNYRELGEYYVHTLSPSEPSGAGTWNDTWDSDVNRLPIHGVVECEVTVVYLNDQREVEASATGSASMFDEQYWRQTGQERWIYDNDSDFTNSVPFAPFADFNATLAAHAWTNLGGVNMGGEVNIGGISGGGSGMAHQDSNLRPNGLTAHLSGQERAGVSGELSPECQAGGAASTASRFNISFALLDRHDYGLFGEIFALDERLTTPATLVSSLRLKNASLDVLYSAAAQPPDFPGRFWESSFLFSNVNFLPAGVYRFDGEALASASVGRHENSAGGRASISFTCGLTVRSLASNALVFNNYSPTRWSPVFGPEPSNPRLFKQGNLTNGLPAGTQTYSGLALTGTNWMVELWGTTGADQPETALQFQARTRIQALTEAEKSFWGMFLAGTVELSGIPNDQPATFQVRVYESRGGAVASWPEVLSDPTVMRGWSERLTLAAAPVRTLQSLESFNVHVPANPVEFAPVFYIQPDDVTAFQGDNVTLRPVILGTHPLIYQWFFRGNSLEGEVAETLSLENVHLADGGGYFLVTSNAYGTATSRVATVTVDVSVTIASQPVRQIVPLRGTAVFSVIANGNPSPSYQWLFNGDVLPGANLSSLIITNVDANNLGGYSVIAWNPYSAATSSVAVLVMSPSIRSPFLGETVFCGMSAMLSVSAVGSGDLGYQWFKNGEPILWGTNSTLVFSAVQFNDAGLYSVVVSSVWGSVTNTPAQLVVTPANACDTNVATVLDLSNWSVIQYGPFLQPPANWVLSDTNTVAIQAVNADASILLSPINLQNIQLQGSWMVNTNDDDDFIGFVFGYQDAQHFYLFDWKQLDQANQPLWGIAEQGMSVKVISANSTLTALDFGATDPPDTNRVRSLYHNRIPWVDFTSYQFNLEFRPGHFNITVSEGAIVLDSISIDDNTYTNGLFGFYNFSQGAVRYSGFSGRGLSERPVVSVTDASVLEGDTGTTNLVFSVSLSRTNCETIRLDYSITPGSATAGVDYTSTLTGTLAFVPGETHRLVTVTVLGDRLSEGNETLFLSLSDPVTGILGDSQAVGTIIDDDPVPVLRIEDLSIREGDLGTTPAIFRLTLSGPSGQPIQVGYSTASQTAVAGQDYTGIASGVLTIPAGQINGFIPVFVRGDILVEPDETFSLCLTNPIHSTLANMCATGTIRNDDSLRSPEITQQPVDQTVTVATDVILSVIASGSPPLSYQWSKDEIELPVETNSVFSIFNVQLSDAGRYWVVVTNAYGAVTSTVATLTVNYSLTVNTSGNGTVLRDPAQPNYAPATVVTLTANPAPGSAFLGWSGDAAGATSPLLVTMTTNKNITANFASTVVSIAIVGDGTVTRFPNQPFYNLGDSVTLMAAPGRWFEFSRWGDGLTVNPREIIIGANNNYTAIFSPTTAVEILTFNGVSRTAPVGMPAVFVNGEFVPNGTRTLEGSAQIEMRTTFPNGLVFYTLDGSTPSFVSSLYAGPLTLRRSGTIRPAAWDAAFQISWEADPVSVVILPTFLLHATTGGGGSVEISPMSGGYVSNAPVTIMASASPGWTFLQWLGDASGTSDMTSVVMTRDKCVEAIFGTTLTTTAAGGGSVVSVPNTGLYPYGAVVRLTAVPQSGNAFALWGNAGSGTNNPLLYAVTNSNRSVSAAFAPLSAGQSSLAVVADGFGAVTASPRGNRFNNGQVVTLTAQPDAGQGFLGWSGDTGATNNPLVTTMNASKIITANFTKRPRLEVVRCGGGANKDEFQLSLTGEFGGRYVIESTTNLAPGTAWTPVATVTNSFGAVQLNDSLMANRTQRFYRATQ